MPRFTTMNQSENAFKDRYRPRQLWYNPPWIYGPDETTSSQGPLLLVPWEDPGNKVEAEVEYSNALSLLLLCWLRV